MKTMRLEHFGFESWARLVKTKFRVWVGANDALDLELYQATSPRTTPAAGGTGAVYESFSLFFLGPADQLLPQRSYAFECEAWEGSTCSLSLSVATRAASDTRRPSTA